MTDDPHNTPSGFRKWLHEHMRVIAIGIAAMALAVAVGAYAVISDDPGTTYGEASGEATGAPASETEAAYEFAECMREQGIDGFPDPTFEADGGVAFETMSDLGVSREELDTAHDACHQFIDEFVPDGEGQREFGRMPADELAAQGWDEITPGGDCACADGSEFRFYARAADPEKVVLFLDGGGACWSAETCDPDGANEYQTTSKTPSGEGVFAVDDERNPFAGYSFVFVPYCTGDVHLGTATTEYTSDLTVRHKGFVNGTAALDHLVDNFPDATDIVVIGASAGSVSAPLYAGLVADRFPDAGVASIADSSGAYPDSPELNDILTGGAWDTADAMSHVSPELQSAPGLYIAAAQRHPDIVFARYDHAYDEEQASKVALAGRSGDDLLALIDVNEAQIENSGVNLLSYTAPGDQHVVLADDAFHSESVGGVDLSDWVAAVINDEPVDDVRCTECSAD